MPKLSSGFRAMKYTKTLEQVGRVERTLVPIEGIASTYLSVPQQAEPRWRLVVVRGGVGFGWLGGFEWGLVGSRRRCWRGWWIGR
jgi:hypothetical protein